MLDNFIPLSVPNIKGNEIRYVTEALESEWVSTGGAMINRFEENIASYVKSLGAVACQSGTAGLHLALRHLKVGAGDEVIVPTLTFIAAVNPVKYVNASPVFMDCDETLCLDPIKLATFLEEECEYKVGGVINKKTRNRIGAIIVVHVFGNIADMESIMKIAKKYQLPVVEDATEALGSYYLSGKYKGRFAGTIGTIGVYSFNGNKIITTGGGGVVVANNKQTLNDIKYLSTQAKNDDLHFFHDEVGYNYRMTSIQAAIGLAQLESLEAFIQVKERNYRRYCAGLNQVEGVRILPFREGIRSNHWFYSLLCEGFAKTRDQLIQELLIRQIQSRPIWGLISEQKPYRESECFLIENAKYYWKYVVNIPCSSNLSEAEVDKVIRVILDTSRIV